MRELFRSPVRSTQWSPQSFKRIWWRTILLGVAIGTLLAFLVYLSYPVAYTAIESLQLKPNTPMKVDAQAKPSSDAVFVGTQRDRLLSSPNLTRALKDAHPAIQYWASNQLDPVESLAKSIAVKMSDSSEIMTVSMTQSDAGTAQIILRSVVDAYLNDVNERIEKRLSRIRELKRILKDCEGRKTRKQDELLAIAEVFNGPGSIDWQMLNREIADLDPVLVRIRHELEQSNSELELNLPEITRLARSVDDAGTSHRRIMWLAIVYLLGMFGAFAIVAVFRVWREFFRAWKRNVGVLALAAACVFTAGWVRSLFEIDSFNCELLDKSWNYFASANGKLTWMTSTSEKPGFTAYEAAMAVGLPSEEDHVVSSNVFSTTTKNSRVKTTKYVFRYWHIVVPLTFISALLLLSKRRPVKLEVEP